MSSTAPNTSATAGFLSPTNAVDDGDGITDLLHALVVGISGLPPDLVRPRWQPQPPQQPDANTDWASIGITEQTPQDYPVELHTGASGDTPGYTTLIQNESLTLEVALFGPNAKLNAEVLGRGVYIGQNRAALRSRNVAVVDAGPVRNAPELVNGQYIGHADITIRLRRQLRIVYPILDLLSGQGSLDTGTGFVDPMQTPNIQDT